MVLREVQYVNHVNFFLKKGKKLNKKNIYFKNIITSSNKAIKLTILWKNVLP